MVYESLIEYLKKHMYVLNHESFANRTNSYFIERYYAKHSLVKPEIIVINDQPIGFKKLSSKVRSLDKYPIFIEIEYSIVNGEKVIERLDIYTEIGFITPTKEADIKKLAHIYSKTVDLEQIVQGGLENNVFLLHSKVGSLFESGQFVEDLESGIYNLSELNMMIEVNLVSFMNLIKILDDVLVKGKNVSKIQEMIENLGHLT